jgi:hypothetical protein
LDDDFNLVEEDDEGAGEGDTLFIAYEPGRAVSGEPSKLDNVLSGATLNWQEAELPLLALPCWEGQLA